MKNEIKSFWHNHPNARHLLKSREGTKEFFEEHDGVVKRLCPYLHEVLDYERCRGKRVLEVGCGMGGQARQMAEKANEFYAIDLAPKSIELTRKRFRIYGINTERIFQGDAENLPFKDASFDLVYSNGVIHHTPDTAKAAKDIFRVMKPDAEAIIMVYHKNSVFWWWDIMIKNKVYYALVKIMPEYIIRIAARFKPSLLSLKVNLADTPWCALGQYSLAAADGHGNPHTKVFTKKEAKELFADFTVIRFDIRGLRNKIFYRFRKIEKRFGFLLFIYLRK